jgi:4-hydroxy-4-methyl-2-oxoglutarate aldolase
MDHAARLSALDACAVSDALNRLGREGVLSGPTHRAGAECIVGRVITVELGESSGVPPSRHLATEAVVSATDGDVIMVAHQGRTDCAGWGGNLSRAAQLKGVSGVIVDGAVRDIDEARQVGFTVFATAATPRTARGRAQEYSWGKPVVMGGIEVCSGDWVVADATGVVVVPAASLESVLAIADEIVANEAEIAEAISRGISVADAMGMKYERMVQR